MEEVLHEEVLHAGRSADIYNIYIDIYTYINIYIHIYTYIYIFHIYIYLFHVYIYETETVTSGLCYIELKT